MLREMAEQPEVLARLLSRRIEVGVEAPAGTIIVARGSSDHAAVYGRYLLELATRRPVALAAPSLFTRYGAETDASGWLVVGVSQSGKTPEIVDVVERLRATGGHAIAITNNGDSPLAEAAETVIELGAGAENAVPATKTFTAQMAAFAVLANALGDVPWDGRPSSPPCRTPWRACWTTRRGWRTSPTAGPRSTSSWSPPAGGCSPPRWRPR